MLGILPQQNGGGGGIRYGTIRPRILVADEMQPFEKRTVERIYMGWDDPTPIYCMKVNPNIRTLMPMVCKPNKAAIAERKLKGQLTKPFPVAEAKNGNGETVELTVNDDDKVVAVKKKGLTPLQMGLIAVGGFLLLGG